MSEALKSKKLIGYLTPLLLILLGVVGLNAVLISVEEAKKSDSWTDSECIIDEVELIDGSETNFINVRYHYSVAGKEYSSTVFEIPKNDNHSMSTLKQKAARLRPGVPTSCFYNSNNPTQAALEKSTSSSYVLAIFPSVIILVGILSLRSKWNKSRETNLEETLDSVSSNSAVYVFSGFLIAAGLGLSYLYFFGPYFRYLSSQSWVAAECKIVSINLETHGQEKRSSPTYRLQSLFEYNFAGKKYVGDTFGLNVDTTSNKEPLEQFLIQYPVGANAPCYVNPNNPKEAVFSREFLLDRLLGLLPLVFVLGGYVIIKRTS